MSDKDGGSAFPVSNPAQELGMTLRDYFAAKALQGLLSGSGAKTLEFQGDCIKQSWIIADAMLAERVKERPGK